MAQAPPPRLRGYCIHGRSDARYPAGHASPGDVQLCAPTDRLSANPQSADIGYPAESAWTQCYTGLSNTSWTHVSIAWRIREDCANVRQGILVALGSDGGVGSPSLMAPQGFDRDAGLSSPAPDVHASVEARALSASMATTRRSAVGSVGRLGCSCSRVGVGRRRRALGMPTDMAKAGRQTSERSGT